MLPKVSIESELNKLEKRKSYVTRSNIAFIEADKIGSSIKFTLKHLPQSYQTKNNYTKNFIQVIFLLTIKYFDITIQTEPWKTERARHQLEIVTK